MERILAHDETTALLMDGKVKPIGYTHDLGMRYYKNNKNCQINLVEFDYDNNGIKDLFFFSDNKLEYFFVDPRREQFIKNIYSEITNHKDVKMNTVIDVVVYGYMDEMLFGKAYRLVAELKKACA